MYQGGSLARTSARRRAHEHERFEALTRLIELEAERARLLRAHPDLLRVIGRAGRQDNASGAEAESNPGRPVERLRGPQIH